jgi:hypothetical protein
MALSRSLIFHLRKGRDDDVALFRPLDGSLQLILVHIQIDHVQVPS